MCISSIQQMSKDSNEFSLSTLIKSEIWVKITQPQLESL